MKVEELKDLIGEVVREVMREEIREILIEAVEIASTPKTSNTNSNFFSERKSNRPTSIADVLQETVQGMTKEDYRNVLQDTSVDHQTQKTGLDMETIIKNAKAVLDTSYDKDRERHAI